MKPSTTTYVGLAGAVLAVSWASILVRWAGGTPALALALYRLFWSALIFAVFFLPKDQGNPGGAPRTLKDNLIILSAGLWLALHFAAWIASLQFTSIAHSLMLYSTQPVFTLLLGPVLIGERGDRRAYLAVLLALAGVALIAGGGSSDGTTRFTGDLLALASALFMTFYLLVARHARGKIGLFSYITRVYSLAALLMLFFCLIAGVELFRYPLKIHLIMFLLAVIPTGIGHSLFNWAARRIETYKVNLAAIGEPVLASLMAYLFFSETPELYFYPGAILILSAILFAMFPRRSRKAGRVSE